MVLDLLGQLTLQNVAASRPCLPRRCRRRRERQDENSYIRRETCQAQRSPNRNMVAVEHDLSNRDPCLVRRTHLYARMFSAVCPATGTCVTKYFWRRVWSTICYTPLIICPSVARGALSSLEITGMP